ncbi:MAG: hypothetical protein AB7E29_04265 [Xanthobacter sp.]
MRRVVVLSDGPVVPVRLLDEDILETAELQPEPLGHDSAPP